MLKAQEELQPGGEVADDVPRGDRVDGAMAGRAVDDDTPDVEYADSAV